MTMPRFFSMVALGCLLPGCIFQNGFEGTWLITYDADDTELKGDCASSGYYGYYDYYYYDDDDDDYKDIEEDQLTAIIAVKGTDAHVTLVDFGWTLTGEASNSELEAEYVDGTMSQGSWKDEYTYSVEAERKSAEMEGNLTTKNVETDSDGDTWTCQTTIDFDGIRVSR